MSYIQIIFIHSYMATVTGLLWQKTGKETKLQVNLILAINLTIRAPNIQQAFLDDLIQVNEKVPKSIVLSDAYRGCAIRSQATAK